MPAVVAMHHPPYPIGVRWIDRMGHARPERLAAVIARHPQVVRVIAGHVHAGSVTRLRRYGRHHLPEHVPADLRRPGGRAGLLGRAARLRAAPRRRPNAVTHFRPSARRAVPAG